MQKIIFLFMLLLPLFVAAQQKQMTLEDAVTGRHTYLLPESLKGLMWKNDQVISWEDNEAIQTEDANSGKKSTLITLAEANAVLNPVTDVLLRDFSNYLWTEKEELILQQDGNYYVLDVVNKKVVWKLIIPAEAENPVLSEYGKLVAYTIDDDVYVSFADSQQVRITKDGGNGIVNGKTVHRSEFGITNGIFISPRGNYIAFYRMDESMVTSYPLVNYTTRVAEHTPVKYPMAGMNSHHVTVGIYNIAEDKTTYLKTGEPFDRYFTNISWLPDEKSVFVAELNRQQNHMKFNRYSVTSENMEQIVFEEKHEKYVEPLHPLLFSKENKNEFYYLSQIGRAHV